MEGFNPEDNLEKFIQGRLSESENRTVLDYLAKNEAALDIVDQLWAQNQGHLLEEALTVPELENTDIQRVERQLIHRLRRSDLGGKALWLGTAGLMKTIMALMIPILNSTQVRQKKG